MNADALVEPRESGRFAGLWFGILAAPVAWALQLPLLYILAVWSCDQVGMASLHVVSLLCLLAAGAGLVRSWRHLAAIGDRRDDAVARTHRLMALLGLGSSILFGILVLASWFAVFLLSPCPQ